MLFAAYAHPSYVCDFNLLVTWNGGCRGGLLYAHEEQTKFGVGRLRFLSLPPADGSDGALDSQVLGTAPMANLMRGLRRYWMSIMQGYGPFLAAEAAGAKKAASSHCLLPRCKRFGVRHCSLMEKQRVHLGTHCLQCQIGRLN